MIVWIIQIGYHFINNHYGIFNERETAVLHIIIIDETQTGSVEKGFTT